MIKISDYERTKTVYWAENEDEDGRKFYKITTGRTGTRHYYTEKGRGYVQRGSDGFWAVFSTLENGRKWYTYTFEHIERV